MIDRAPSTVSRAVARRVPSGASISFTSHDCTAAGGVGWLDWPCCQNPGRKPATSRRAMARET
jgi:hypothetical protein